MSGHEEQAPVRQAVHRRGWWPGWIWSVPVAALGIVIWLVLRNVTQTGPEVTVIFPEVAELKSGDTKVKFEGMDVGEVEDVKLEPDLRHLRVKLRLKPDLRGHLGPGTAFWISGKEPNLAHLSDLKAIITGVSISIQPKPGHKQATYEGLAQPPALGFGAEGTRYTLTADRLGSVQRGTPIYYLDQKVGEVVGHSMTDGHGFQITVFVDKPYDQLVHDGSRFWRAGPVRLATGSDGPSVQFRSLPALFQGALAFDTPGGSLGGAVAGADRVFRLYDGEDEAQYAPDAEGVAYHAVFHGASGVPGVNAAVTLMGHRVGSVSAARLVWDPESGTLNVDTTIVLEPRDIPLAGGARWTDPRRQMDDMIGRLVAAGLEAEIVASPPVVGSQQIQLTMVPGRSGTLGPGPVPEIPTRNGGGGVAGIMSSVSDVVNKVDEMPLDQIAGNLRDVAQHMASLTSSPALESTLQQLDRSTANLAQITGDVRHQLPQTLEQLRRTVSEAQRSLASAQDLLSVQGTAASVPGSASLPETLYEISRTARALRELSSFLDRHPSAVLTGRGANQ